jgi:hypothetical protein
VVTWDVETVVSRQTPFPEVITMAFRAIPPVSVWKLPLRLQGTRDGPGANFIALKKGSSGSHGEIPERIIHHWVRGRVRSVSLTADRKNPCFDIFVAFRGGSFRYTGVSICPFPHGKTKGFFPGPVDADPFAFSPHLDLFSGMWGHPLLKGNDG